MALGTDAATSGKNGNSRRRSLLFALVLALILLGINVAIAAKLFVLEYSGYLHSNEGSFIAIARQVAAHPRDLMWWPLWDCGLPFQNTYLPFLQLMVGGFIRLTDHSAALSFHQVTALFYCAGPLAVYAMGWGMTGRIGASFLAALLYSLVSPCAWLVPLIRVDLGSAWNLRRLQNVVYYGEAPLAVSLAFVPLTILFLYLLMSGERRGPWVRIAAGVSMGLTILPNAFGVVIISIVSLCLLATIRPERFWRNVFTIGVLGLLAYAWISPLFPPSVIAVIRMNSPTVEGDYRFTERSLFGMCVLAGGFLLLWFLTRHRSSPVVRFFLLFALLTSGIVILGVGARVYVLPQPHRYQLAMDMALCMLFIFGGRELLGRVAPRQTVTAAAVLIIGMAVQFRNVLNYAHHEIKAANITTTGPYRAARWLDGHMNNARVAISGQHSFHFNDFSDLPQVFGGHEPMLPNFVMRIAYYVIHKAAGAEDQNAEISILWLKALGAHALLVPDEGPSAYYKPFVDPSKFEGILLTLWRENGDTIYKIPARSMSLAHVVPDGAVVRHTPVHGLDVREIRNYVSALEDPQLPESQLIWINRHTAAVRTNVHPDQSLSLQITYTPGWRATVNGIPQGIGKDGLGFMVLKPRCDRECEFRLTYDGGSEWRLTCLASILVTVAVVLGVTTKTYFWRTALRR